MYKNFYIAGIHFRTQSAIAPNILVGVASIRAADTDINGHIVGEWSEFIGVRVANKSENWHLLSKEELDYINSFGASLNSWMLQKRTPMDAKEFKTLDTPFLTSVHKILTDLHSKISITTTTYNVAVISNDYSPRPKDPLTALYFSSVGFERAVK